MVSKSLIPEWMQKYYAESVSGSVIESYETGRVVIVNGDAPVQKQTEDTADIKDAERKLQAAQDEIDARYWIFTRCKGVGIASLAEQSLYDRRNACRERLLDLCRLRT